MPLDKLLKLGHWSNRKHRTGCTVFLFEKGAHCAVSTQGAASATHETVLLSFPAFVDRINAIFWTGGSLKGLNSVGGVQRFLEEQNRGFCTPAGVLPIVPAMAIYDFGTGAVSVPLDENAYEACKSATGRYSDEKSVGAGCGATVGKANGVDFCSESGFGWSEAFFRGSTFCCFALCNAFGDVKDPETGEILAGVKDGKGGFLLTQDVVMNIESRNPFANCTFLLLVTDVRLDERQLQWMADCLRGTIASVVSPSPTPFDYDVAIVASVSDKDIPLLPMLGITWKLGQRALLRCVDSSFSPFV